MLQGFESQMILIICNLISIKSLHIVVTDIKLFREYYQYYSE